jgi:Ca2+/Na+ antiporter
MVSAWCLLRRAADSALGSVVVPVGTAVSELVVEVAIAGD